MNIALVLLAETVFLALCVFGLYAVGVVDAEFGARKISQGVSLFLTIPARHENKRAAIWLLSAAFYTISALGFAIFYAPKRQASRRYFLITSLFSFCFVMIVTFHIHPNPQIPQDHPASKVLYLDQFPGSCGNWTSGQRLGAVEPVPNRKLLNLIFHLDPRPADHGGNIFETDWIELVLLGAIERPLRVFRWDQKFYNDSIHVILGHPPDDLFFKMRRHGYVNFGSVQMADEFMIENNSFYADCDFTFRFFWNRAHASSVHNVHFVPLGVKTGLGHIAPGSLIPSSQRRYLCNFVGSLRANRAHALSQVWYRRRDCYISADLGWADPDGVHIVHYRHLLRDSTFTLAPYGGNEESLRFYEALEAGSIPIAQRSQSPWGDFIDDGLGGDPPVVRISEWCEVNEVMAYYSGRPREMDALQRRVVAWWASRRAAAQATVRRVLDESFAAAHGVGS